MSAHRWRAGALLVTSFAMLASITGCQRVSRHVDTAVSPCFRVLPTAHAAVGGEGTLTHVERAKGRAGDGSRRKTGPPTSPPSTSPQSRPSVTGPAPQDSRGDVCLVTYRGSFNAAHIDHIVGTARTGRYATVVVGVTSRRVRAVFLSDHPGATRPG